METERHKQTENETNRLDSQEQIVVDALKLFEGRREIWLELDGVRYRLRITRRNKLILQK